MEVGNPHPATAQAEVSLPPNPPPKGVVMDSQDDAMGMYATLFSDRVVVDEAWDDTQNCSPFGVQAMQNEVATPRMRPNNKRTRNFSNEEDEVLVSSWLHTSMDPIRNELRNASYWKRIHEKYELHKPQGSERSVGSLTHRWSVVKEQVGRFCDCFEQIMNRNGSGMTEDDKIVEACSMYKATDKTKRSFVLLHCWSLLRYNKKWLAQIDRSSQSNKKQKSSSNAIPSISTPGFDTIHIDDSEATSRGKAGHMRRPIGKKAEKERQCRGKNITSSDDSSVLMALDHVFSKRTEVEEARQMSRKIARQSREVGKKEHYAKVLAIEQRKLEIKEISQEMEIMNKDISSMDEEQKEYYKMLRRDIIARRSKRSI